MCVCGGGSQYGRAVRGERAGHTGQLCCALGTSVLRCTCGTVINALTAHRRALGHAFKFVRACRTWAGAAQRLPRTAGVRHRTHSHCHAALPLLPPPPPASFPLLVHDHTSQPAQLATVPPTPAQVRACNPPSRPLPPQPPPLPCPHPLPLLPRPRPQRPRPHLWTLLSPAFGTLSKPLLRPPVPPPLLLPLMPLPLLLLPPVMPDTVLRNWLCQ